MNKAQKKKFEWAIPYLKAEAQTGRHIAACMGSAGFTFYKEIGEFKAYLVKKNEAELLGLIQNDEQTKEQKRFDYFRETGKLK